MTHRTHKMEKEFSTAALFGERAFSDLTVKFSGQELPLHKVVLCTKSEYFKKALEPGGKLYRVRMLPTMLQHASS